MYRVNLCLISSMLSVILLFPAFCPAETIPVGSGSYSTEWPDYGGHFERQNEYTGWVSTGYGPPLTIFKTNNVNQPVPTNDWWSSVAWLRYSSELWSIPMAYKFTAQGLEAMGTFYKTGTTPWYQPKEHNYVGGFKTQVLESNVWVSQWSKDVLISGTDLSPEDARVDSFTDWSTDIKMTQADKSITAKLVTASPYLYLTFENCSPVITLPDSNFDIQTKDGLYITDTHTGDTIRTYDSETTHAYGWFAPAGTIFSRSGTDINITLPESQNWLVMGLLSLDGTNISENHKTLYDYAYAWPDDTRVTWNYDRINSKVTLVYDVTTESRQYDQTTTVQGIYPHQYKHMQETYTGIEYQTHRGYVKTLAGNSFTVNLTFHGFLPYFPVPESGDFDRNTMVNYLADRVNTPIQSNPEIAFDHNDQPNIYQDYNTYWAGRNMNVMARLIPIANILDDSSTDFFKASVEASLTDWLKVNSEYNEVTNPDVDLDKYFVYLSDWGGLIGFRPGFGSEHFTDHHFHNGYFIYSAAILSLFDPVFADNYGGMIELLIKEYASDLRPSDLPDPSTAQFPFLRGMDLYHGHSWADGIGHDGWRNRGNNQESVSEALNSAAAIALWGAATGQENLIDLGVVLHCLEYSAAREYWYDIDRDIYDHSVYNTTYVTSLLFGDQATNQIWFGEEPEWKHGILYLPFTPSSLYLGLNPTFVQNDYQALLNEAGGINDWCDVIGMYRAFYDPAGAVTDFNDAQDAQHAGDWGYTYFFIHSLNNFGQVKSSVTADIPFYAVFDNNGTTNYMAYNHTDSTITVHFSDDYQMDVPAGELASTVGQVKPVPNSPPVISNLPDQTLDEDTFIDNAFNLNDYASDPNAWNTLTFSIVDNTFPDCGVSIDAENNIDITPTADWNGQSEVTIQVSDGKATDTDMFIITVQPVEEPPEIEVFSDSFEESEWNGLWVEDSQNDWFRSTTRATDGSYSAEIDGRAVNAVLISIPIDLQGKTSATVTFSWYIESGLDNGEYLAFDVSTDGGVTWVQKASLNGNVDAENTWGNVSIDLTGMSNLQIRFRGKMSKADEAANIDSVKVTVLGGAENQNPQIISTPITTATENQLYTYDVDATDADGDNLTYSFNINPGGMNIDSETGIITWTPDQSGNYAVETQVSDGKGGIDTQNFSINVANVNDDPVITNLPASDEATVNQLYEFDVNATDEDNDILGYSLTLSPADMTININSGLISWTPNSSQEGPHTITVKVTDGNGGSDIENYTLTVNPESQEIEVFFDSFDGNEWNGLWVEDSQNDWSCSTKRATDGSYSAQIAGRTVNAALTSIPVDLQGKTSATISFWWYIESGLDNGEYLAFDVSTDGGVTWVQKTSLNGNVDPENTWRNVSIDITGMNNLQIRFRGKMNKSDEAANVDLVKIIAR